MILSRIRAIWYAVRGRSEPKWPRPVENGVIVHAFTDVDGTPYYKFASDHSISISRYFAASMYLNEFEMKVDKELLSTSLEELIAALTPTATSNSANFALNVQGALEIAYKLKERTEFVFAPDALYKLCAVYYFSEDEDPLGFDYAYADAKIARWKKSEATHAFFLRTGITALLPLPNFSPESFRDYTKATLIREREIVALLLRMSSTASRESKSASSLRSRMETLKSSLAFGVWAFMTIICL